MLLYLIRHSIVSPRPDEPAPRWRLSPEGRDAADALAREPFWSELHGIHTSYELKTVATAQRLAAPNELPIRIERDLREVDGRAWVQSGYADLVQDYLAGDPPDGWERPEVARSRMRDCIDGIVERHSDVNVGIVSHGIVLTVYLADVLDLDAEASIELWQSMRFPDVAVLDLERKRFEREFGA
jgi:broad specificity phosphatase PhoE